DCVVIAARLCRLFHDVLSLHDALPIFASFRDLNVIINLQRHIHALAFANHSWTARDFTDLRAREQNIRTFQQSTRVIEADGERRSEEHTSELKSRFDLVCRLLLEKQKM